MNRFILTLALCALAIFPLASRAAPASGYWWNPAEPGRGYVIDIQCNTMTFAAFLYASSGEAAWSTSAGAMTSATQYSGALMAYGGGQTLNGTYTAPKTSTALGNVSISFTSDSTAILTWPGGSVPIQRYSFGQGGAGAAQPAGTPQTGIWWNPAEGGRGFSIEVQGGTMYLAGYMYDQLGNPIWYLAAGSMNGTTLFPGQFAQYANGQTMMGAFRPASNVGIVGGFTMQFTDNADGTLSLSSGSRAFTLQRYVPANACGTGGTGGTTTPANPLAGVIQNLSQYANIIGADVLQQLATYNLTMAQALGNIALVGPGTIFDGTWNSYFGDYCRVVGHVAYNQTCVSIAQSAGFPGGPVGIYVIAGTTPYTGNGPNSTISVYDSISYSLGRPSSINYAFKPAIQFTPANANPALSAGYAYYALPYVIVSKDGKVYALDGTLEGTDLETTWGVMVIAVKNGNVSLSCALQVPPKAPNYTNADFTKPVIQFFDAAAGPSLSGNARYLQWVLSTTPAYSSTPIGLYRDYDVQIQNANALPCSQLP